MKNEFESNYVSSVKRYSDADIIVSQTDGFQAPYSWFYKQSRPTFMKHVSIKMQAVPVLAEDENYYSDELFQESHYRLSRSINEGKLFVKEDTVFYVNKLGEETKMKGSLTNFLISIGDNILKEFIRTYANGTMVRIEDLLQKKEGVDDENNEINFDDNDGSGSYSSVPERDNAHILDNYFGCYAEEDVMAQSVRIAFAKMPEPGKSILKYTFYMEDGKKLRDDEIAVLIGFKNATSVKSKRYTSMKLFRKILEEELRNN